MEFIKVNALKRASKGKGAARRMRNAGRVPAVVYGKNTETQAISVKPEELTKALAGPLRVNTPLDVAIADTDTQKVEDALVIVKDHQYDPITRNLLHVDFLSIKETETVQVEVPVEKSGRSIGEQLGGVVRMVHRTIPIVCLPKDIPAKVAVDVTSLKAGITFHASDLTLAEGLAVALPPQEAILTISAVKEEEGSADSEEAAAPAAK